MQLAQLGLVASRLENDDWVELSEEGDTDLINLVGAGPAVHLTLLSFSICRYFGHAGAVNGMTVACPVSARVWLLRTTSSCFVLLTTSFRMRQPASRPRVFACPSTYPLSLIRTGRPLPTVYEIRRAPNSGRSGSNGAGRVLLLHRHHLPVKVSALARQVC